MHRSTLTVIAAALLAACSKPSRAAQRRRHQARRLRRSRRSRRSRSACAAAAGAAADHRSEEQRRRGGAGAGLRSADQRAAGSTKPTCCSGRTRRRGAISTGSSRATPHLRATLGSRGRPGGRGRIDLRDGAADDLRRERRQARRALGDRSRCGGSMTCRARPRRSGAGTSSGSTGNERLERVRRSRPPDWRRALLSSCGCDPAKS